VLGGDGGVVQGAPLVDIAVDIGGRHPDRAQQEEIGEEPVELVDR
jgi:hypothetical protein